MTLEPLAGAADEELVPLDEVVVDDDVSVFAEQPANVAPSVTATAHVRKR